MLNTRFGCGSGNLVSNLRTDDLDESDYFVRTTVLDGNITLDTFIPSEVDDWSGDHYPVGPLLAPAVYGCTPQLLSVFISSFFFSFFQKSNEVFTPGTGGDSSERLSHVIVISCMIVFDFGAIKIK